MDESKKKTAIVVVCSIILVAMVVTLVVINHDVGEPEPGPDVNASKKAIANVCDTTDYKKTCVDSLSASGTNATDPQELIKVVFQSTMKFIDDAVQNSTTLEEVEKDPRAKAALETCKELAQRAGVDLERSFAKFNAFDLTIMDDILFDLKIWLSGAITQQETCLDGFEDIPSDAGEKMREALTTAMEMTSNALAVVQELSTFIEAMGIQSYNSRRLLASNLLPDWMDPNARMLLNGPPEKIKADIVVAKDGSGKYTSINKALEDIPKRGNERFVLYIKEGVYNEIVKINSSLTHLMIIGDGPTKTRITGKLNYIDGVSTYHTATVAVQGDDFIARDIGFENSAGAHKHQAVALRVSADKTLFYNCHMDGYQDTLYAHTYRQFYRDCVVSGTIDFVFGDSAAVFQGCKFIVRKPMDNQQCIVTAQGRKELRQPTGLVLQNCTITADSDYFPATAKVKTFLGRPWKEFSRTVIMESFLDRLVDPEGWLPWNETFGNETCFYTEFNNRGPAAPKNRRVTWLGVKELPPERVQRFTAEKFIDGNTWIPVTHVPYDGGFIFPVPKEDPNIKYSPVSTEETKDLGTKSSQTTLSPLASPPSANGPAANGPAMSASEVIITTPAASIAPSGASRPDVNSSIWDLRVNPKEELTPSIAAPPSESPESSPIAGTPSGSPEESPIAGAPTASPAASPIFGAPSGSPAASPIAGAPSDSPAVSAIAGAPSDSPAASPMAGAPSDSPAASPMAGAPSDSPAVSPIASSPSDSPAVSPIADAPSDSPAVSPIGGAPSDSPAASPMAGAPSHSPAASPIAGAPHGSLAASPTAATAPFRS